MKNRYFVLIIIMLVLLISLILRLMLKSAMSETDNTTEVSMISQKSLLISPEEAISYQESIPALVSTQSYTSLFPELYTSSEGIPARLPEGQKVAYLTFDDGPSSITDSILELLDKENIKATFFVMGCGIAEKDKVSIERLKAISDAGHVIGIHTYSHDYCEIYSSVGSFLNDFNKAYKAIDDNIGIKSNIFRFPGGSNNVFIKNTRGLIIDEMARRGFSYYDWNVSAEDAVGRPTSASIEKNLKKAYSYSYPVLLMHDAYYNERLLKVLPGIISELKTLGYSFDTLDNRVPIHFAN